MKNNRIKSLFSTNSVITSDDTRFLNITIDVLHTGLNLNGSFFEKEVVDKSIHSIKNTPILGFVKYNKLSEKMDFTGHEYILIQSENSIDESCIASAYGVIPESCNPRWIKKKSDDGIEREYLQVDALLWTKFDESSDIFERDGSKAQSMELELASIDGYEDKDKIYHFTNFRFDGCCILGDGVEPAMVNSIATLQNFSISDFKKELQKQFDAKFVEFSQALDIQNKEGGKKDMPKKDFSQTLKSTFEDIKKIVAAKEMITDDYYDYPRFQAVDVQDEEVIMIDRKDYNFYGASLTFEGDKPIIDFDNIERKKIQYVKYECGKEEDNQVSNAFSIIIDGYKKVLGQNTKRIVDLEAKMANVFELEEKFNLVEKELNEIKPKYDKYVNDEQDRIKAEELTKKQSMIEKFAKILADNNEYKEIVEKVDDFSVQDIETKLAILYTKVSMQDLKEKEDNLATFASVEVTGCSEANANNIIETKYGLITIK